MSNSKQRQSAGDNSQLMQASTINIYNGIDEVRARAIIDERLQEVLNEYTHEAQEIARDRIEVFADDLIPRLVKENLMDNLKDPSIQILLQDAQKAAASTEREADYSLLSELLIHRVKKGSDRSIRAGVSRAIKIVDEISNEALQGLTIAHAISTYSPVTGNIREGIKILDMLFSKIIYGELPKGGNWVDDLDVLDAVRITPFGGLKKAKQFYTEVLSGYVEAGIEKSTDNYQKAVTIIKNAKLPVDILCDHELKDGYARLRIVSIDRLDLIVINKLQQVKVNGKVVIVPTQVKLSDEQKMAIRNVYELYDKSVDIKNGNIEKFMKTWDEYDNLKKVKDWWDNIENSFVITSVGRVLAHANAQRCDSTLPELN